MAGSAGAECRGDWLNNEVANHGISHLRLSRKPIAAHFPAFPREIALGANNIRVLNRARSGPIGPHGKTIMNTDDNRYSALIKTRAPEALRAAVEIAADRELTSASAYTRRAIINQLRADGIPLTPFDQAAA